MSGLSADFKNDLIATPTVFPASLSAGATNGVAVDAVNMSEMGARLVVGVVTGATTIDGKIQESAVVGSGYVDVPGATFTQVVASSKQQIINFKRTLRFVRGVLTVAGTSALCGCDIYAQQKVY